MRSSSRGGCPRRSRAGWSTPSTLPSVAKWWSRSSGASTGGARKRRWSCTIPGSSGRSSCSPACCRFPATAPWIRRPMSGSSFRCSSGSCSVTSGTDSSWRSGRSSCTTGRHRVARREPSPRSRDRARSSPSSSACCSASCSAIWAISGCTCGPSGSTGARRSSRSWA